MTQIAGVPQDSVEALGEHERHADDENARPEQSSQQRRAAVERGVDARHRHLPKGAPRPSLPPLHRDAFLFAANTHRRYHASHICVAFYFSAVNRLSFVHVLQYNQSGRAAKKCRGRAGGGWANKCLDLILKNHNWYAQQQSYWRLGTNGNGALRKIKRVTKNFKLFFSPIAWNFFFLIYEFNVLESW